MSVAQVQIDQQTEEWYMVAIVLKYGSANLIILIYCAYLLGVAHT